MKIMKKLSVSLVFFLFMFDLLAQDQSLPKEEFLFVSKVSVATVQRGETSKVPLEILRSKRYQKSMAELSVGSSLPAGITATYEESNGVLNSATLILSASNEAAAGEYNVILNCTLGNKRKGVILKLKVI